jgi:hypothetical protein
MQLRLTTLPPTREPVTLISSDDTRESKESQVLSGLSGDSIEHDFEAGSPILLVIALGCTDSPLSVSLESLGRAANTHAATRDQDVSPRNG